MSGPESNTEGETITTYELLERSARAALDLQRGDGSFPPGRNGVYDEPETPVRTTGRWLQTLSKVYEITGDGTFREPINDAVEYLLSDTARPHGYTFLSRETDDKTKCDGLVGQSVPIRGLVYAGKVLERSDIIEVAEEIFELHPFNEELGLWEIVEIDGTKLSFDRTLNHQIIFAAAAADLATESTMAHEKVQRFLDMLGQNMRTRPSGLVRHYIRPRITKIIPIVIQTPRHWPLLWNEAIARMYTYSSKRRDKELGYHSTVLTPLAILNMRFGNHSIWDHERIKAAIQFINNDSYKEETTNQKSNYSSYLPAINHALILQAFKDGEEKKLQKWIAKDLRRCYDPNKKLLVNDTIDPEIQSSLVNTLIYIENIRIGFN